MKTTQTIFNNFLDNLTILACKFYVASCKETKEKVHIPNSEELSELIRNVGCQFCDFWKIDKVKEEE